jgi:serine protease AprX
MPSQNDPQEHLYLNMMRSIVTEPLLSEIQDEKDDQTTFDVIVSLNELYKGGLAEARKYVQDTFKIPGPGPESLSAYVFARVTKRQILDIVDDTRKHTAEGGPRAGAIYRIWEDHEISAVLTKSIATVKADAAQRAFQARGEEIVWAVLDSGIQADHAHFNSANFKNLDIADPLAHVDYTPLQNGAAIDEFGHGTHVAGIIAGCWESPDSMPRPVVGAEVRDERFTDPVPERQNLRSITGIAPCCRLVSMKVIADQGPNQGKGKVSWVLQAIDQIQQWNQYGKRLLVHGVNMSLGYEFDARWFGCGQSPICVEVNRLVKCGVAVVVAAGNGGYTQGALGGSHYNDLSINDPGNADLAITVGSTHREMPHLYGVSYFSSRGPTGDGRMKPDLVAPGERIISCAAGSEADKYRGLSTDGTAVLYCELSGTSMAAPHVSGAIAAFLSVRREFIGQPEQVKQIFVNNTIDLRREPKFQGAGLVDLMKVLQSV